MNTGTQNRTAAQTAVAVSVVATVATIVAVKMGTSYVWRNLREAFEGEWADFYDGLSNNDDDDDDEPDLEVYAEVRE